MIEDKPSVSVSDGRGATPYTTEEAQKSFRRVVKNQLQVLLKSGVTREEAVQQLLKRIVLCVEVPPLEQIEQVMSQFHMQKEDAIRALIVKQELVRLRKHGLDPLSAIEELTQKMQRLPVGLAQDSPSASLKRKAEEEAAINLSAKKKFRKKEPKKKLKRVRPRGLRVEPLLRPGAQAAAARLPTSTSSVSPSSSSSDASAQGGSPTPKRRKAKR
jgi:hypothetical protein